MDQNTSTPILYSFRRCPYAMRARLALVNSEQQVVLREVVLKDKPAHMLTISPKGTVPVLVLNPGKQDQQIIDESLDIMLWVLDQNDKNNWLPDSAEDKKEQLNLVAQNDGDFKRNLDRYKYADRFPDQAAEVYRAKGEEFLALLETRLQSQPFLFGSSPMFADYAIFPFIRQFAHVDKAWFDQANFPHLQTWLNIFLNSELFKRIMPKFQKWLPESEPVYL